MPRKKKSGKKKGSRKAAIRRSPSSGKSAASTGKDKQSAKKKKSKKKAGAKKGDRKKTKAARQERRRRDQRFDDVRVVQRDLQIIQSGAFRIAQGEDDDRIEDGFQSETFNGGGVEDESVFSAERLTRLMVKDLDYVRNGVYHSPDADDVALYHDAPGAEEPGAGPLRRPNAGEVDFDRTQVKATTKQPWRAICRLLIQSEKDNETAHTVATGFFISPTVVVTAGHAVVSPATEGRAAQWATKITVCPGARRDGTGAVEQPYGMISSTKFLSLDRWSQDSRTEYDIGCILLDYDTIGKQTGWFGFAAYSTDSLTDLLINVAGYPVSQPPGSLWYDAGRISTVGSQTLEYNLETGRGTSGGPAFKSRNGKRTVIGIHNYSFNNDASGISTRITSDIFDVMKKWKSMS